jgi:SAM-dependent methyltransferase
MPDSYSIKDGYRPNLTRGTYDPEGDPDFWNDDRIAAAGQFQYYVYASAARLARKRGARLIMDIGSGPPIKMKTFFEESGAEIRLIDQPAVKTLASELLPRAKFVAADLETIDLDLGTKFDLVICADVLEHLLDPTPCLRFARNHLAQDGLLVVSTPERDVVRGKSCMECSKPEHVREWNAQEFVSYLRSQGLRVLSHSVVPQRPVGRWRYVRAWLGHALGRPPGWFSCQMAVCRKA